jgi:pyridine nucleotide-disulfide oxidoreductase
MSVQDLPIAVLGAGPVGLAAAAELACRDLHPLVLESGPAVGHAVHAWSHVPMFSPWRYNVSAAALRILRSAGWNSPEEDQHPTGGELIERYLEPLATTALLRDRIRVRSRVVAVGRQGIDKVPNDGRVDRPFELHVEGTEGRERVVARAVIDATGTWFQPCPAGANGLPALGESEAGERIRYGMPDVLGAERTRYEGRSVMVVGRGHSAIGTILDLLALKAASPATRVLWAVRTRHVEKAFGGGAADALPARGALGLALRRAVMAKRIEILAPFLIAQVRCRPNDGLTVCAEDGAEAAVDEVIVATGLRPDVSLLRELRVDLDPTLECPRALAPLIDPNIHSCGTVRPHGAAELSHPERDFFIAGMKSYGRAPTFLLATGHEQVRSIVAHLAGDRAAAARVELVLPETGVCSSTPLVSKAAVGERLNATAKTQKSCCGGDKRGKGRGC